MKISRSGNGGLGDTDRLELGIYLGNARALVARVRALAGCDHGRHPSEVVQAIGVAGTASEVGTPISPYAVGFWLCILRAWNLIRAS